MDSFMPRFEALEGKPSKAKTGSVRCCQSFRKIYSVVERCEILEIKKFLRVLKNRSKIEENYFETFLPNQSKLSSVSISPDNNLLLCTFIDSRAKLFTLSSPNQEFQEILSLTNSSSSCFSPDSKSFAIASEEIHLFSLPMSKISDFPGKSKVKKITYSKSSRFLLSLYSDNLIKIWNIDKKEEYFNLNFKDLLVFSVALSVDDRTLAVGSIEKHLKLWNIKEKSEINEINFNSSPVRSLVYSPDGHSLVIGSQDRSLKVFDLASQDIKIVLRCKTGYSVSLEFNLDSTLLLAGLSSSFIDLWNCKSWTKVFNMFLSFSPEIPVVMSFDGSKILSVNKDNTLKLMKIDENRISEIFKFSDEVIFAGFSFDKKNFFTFESNGIAKIFSIESGKESFQLQFRKNTVRYLDLSRSNKYFAVVDEYEKVIIWNLEEKSEEFSLSKDEEGFSLVTFTCEDRGIILTGRSGNILVKVFNSFDDEIWFKGHKEAVVCISVKNDNRWFATGSIDRTVRVWDLENTNKKTVLKGHENEVFCVGFSSNPKYLVSGSSEGLIKVWNLKEMFEEFCLNPEISSLKRFEISPSNQILLLTTDDQLKILDLEERCEKSSFSLISARNNNIEILSATFSVTEDSISFIYSDGTFNLLTLKQLTASRNYKIFQTCCQSFSNDCKFYACLKGTSEILIYNLKNKDVFHRLSHENSVIFIRFTQNSDFMIVGFTDMLWVYNLKEKKKELSITGEFKPVLNAFLIYSEKKKSWFLTLCYQVGFDVYKNEQNIFQLSDFDIDEVKVTSEFNLQIKNKFTQQVIIFDIITERINELPGNGIDTGEVLYMDPESIYNDMVLRSRVYLNIFSSIESKDYQSYELNFDKTQISNINLTVLHILSYLDKAEICQSLLKKHNPLFLTDIFGHSPLFYSLIKNYQRTVDVFLLHISSTSTSSPVFSSNIFSLRNDFQMIIKNSSTFLQNFLIICMEMNKQIKPTLVNIPSGRFVHISASLNPFPPSVYTQKWRSSIKLIHPKTCYIPLPFGLGSHSTLSLVESIESCTNDLIFKTEFVQSYLLALWEKNYLIVLCYSLLLWVNLIWIAFIVEDNFYLTVFAVLLLLNNILLMIWEGLLIKHQGLRYYLDIWNLLDFFRIILTTIWVIMKFFDKEKTGIVWFVVLLNVIRGLIGFRAFDLTRFYIKLIYKSLSDISSFMLIFIYSILSFGLLNATTQNKSIGFESLWMDSFALIYGDKAAMYDSDFGFQYVTLVLAIWINVVFLLKIIISIFGNSFSVFKEKAEIYNFQEMAEVLLETFQVFVSAKKIEEIGYLHAGGIWGGQSVDQQKRGIDSEIINFAEKFEGIISRIDGFEKQLGEIRKGD